MSGPRKAELTLLAAVVWTTAVPATAQEFRRLNAAEIRTQIIGRDLTDDYHWTEYYRRDGRLEIEDLGHRKNGRWRVERDLLCTANDRASPLRCWQVWLSGSEVSLRERPDDRTPPTFLRRHQGN
ncbi:hypothetical protein JYK14_06580 [Siccirubricoccus sp. KC 17139]|uniref:Uncharacterized protein n=1 Tax=Siccirubricoccus soli TaxID=2899147 RepID=A0ABT1D3I5_9PROT|nr:hypothetical protein [Siccirubricoccus soli]MCO6415840.1 hypothetical protein [Siccirubricoccus soli]MCP2681972.1 hypothetical protein [Siccirubricoccus soli]